MQTFLYGDKEVQATMWNGEPFSGLTIIEQSWGKVGEIKTAKGVRWLTVGDWLILDNGKYDIATPAIFSLNYRLKV